jgi:hypothetical protein
MQTAIDNALQRIPPEYRPTAKQLAWDFLSEEIRPSTVSIPSNTVLVRFIEHAIYMFGIELVKDIGVANLWSFMYHYLEQNIGHTEKAGRSYINVRPARYKEKRMYTIGHNSNMFDIERALGLRPPKTSELVQYDISKHGDPKMNGRLN